MPLQNFTRLFPLVTNFLDLHRIHWKSSMCLPAGFQNQICEHLDIWEICQSIEEWYFNCSFEKLVMNLKAFVIAKTCEL